MFWFLVFQEGKKEKKERNGKKHWKLKIFPGNSIVYFFLAVENKNPSTRLFHIQFKVIKFNFRNFHGRQTLIWIFKSIYQVFFSFIVKILYLPLKENRLEGKENSTKWQEDESFLKLCWILKKSLIFMKRDHSNTIY